MIPRMKRWLVALVVAMLAVIAVSSVALSARNNVTTTPGKPVSMVDAYNQAQPNALAWDPQARLYWMNSVDTKGNTDSTQGLDGKRLNWNVEFVVPGTDRHLTVFVVNGQAEGQTEFKNPVLWEPFDGIPAIPIARILSASKVAGVNPSKMVSFGYHFKLHKRTGKPTMSVVGQHDEARTEIQLDPETAELQTGN